MHLELKDLPPNMRAQALKIILEEDIKRGSGKGTKKGTHEGTVKKGTDTDKGSDIHIRAQAATVDKKRFDSRGEWEYYFGTVIPKMRTGEVLSCEEHPAFKLYEKGEYCGIKLGSIRYTADFKLTYADGRVEIVEIKSKFVRRMQRDYPVRRRAFIEQYARPQGWKFTEIITDKTDKG